MPIPHLKKVREQSWRNSRKKYFLNRNSNPGILNLRKDNGGYKSKHPGGFWAWLRPKLFWGTLIGIGLVIIVSVGILTWISGQIPDPGKLSERQLAQSTKIFDRTGEKLLYEIHGSEQRTMVKLDELPEYVKHATIAIEDKDFYKHKGVSLWGIFRGVVWRKLRGLSAQGGSTLTQQLVKNAILTNERTLDRKIKEWLLAYKIEQKYGKEEILQMYFNEIPYGSTAYGVEAAAQKYFGKSARDITVAEAAVLAALPQAPSRYSPYGPNIDLLMGRKDYVIEMMVEQGYLSQEDADIAKAQEVVFKEQGADIEAPHFVMYVKQVLSERYGEKTVEQGGLRIITTLDLYKQNIAEEIITEKTKENEEKWDATNAALLSLDPKTGQVLAMVGSRDYFNDDIDGKVNITTSSRQPGSSMKPLVYATAFLKGYTPDTILYDVVTNFSSDPEKVYEPHNYNLRENGPVTIRKALAGSLNIPAVKAIYLAGINNVLDLAKDLGYSTFNDRDRFGLSLVLGGGEVKMIEHVNAFSAFSREGVINDIETILKVEDSAGNVLEEYKEKSGKNVLDPKVARQINDILSDNAARSFVFGANNWLTLGSRPVAAKTGTTNDYRDAWTIGYTPSIVTGVWVGNNDNSEMKRGADGGIIAAPIWHDYMDKILGDTPIEQFKKPDAQKTGKPILDGEVGAPIIYRIDKSTGLLASEYTPAELIEERSYYEPHSILYYVSKDDPRGQAPEHPENDPQFELWESRVKAWAEKQTGTSTPFSENAPPTEVDNVHIPENIPELTVVHPNKNQAVLEPKLIARVGVKAKRGIDRVEYYINDNLFFVNHEYPYSLEKDISFLSNGFHNLRIRACDDVGNCAEETREFNLILENNNINSDAAVSLTAPASGLAISNVDLPIQFAFAVNNPSAIARINIYELKEGESTPHLAGAIQSADISEASFNLDRLPESGTYKYYGEAVTWGKKSFKTADVILIVNNVKPAAEEKTDEQE